MLPAWFLLPLLLAFLVSCQHNPAPPAKKQASPPPPTAQPVPDANPKPSDDKAGAAKTGNAPKAGAKPEAKGAKKAGDKGKKAPAGQMAVSPVYNEELNIIIDLTKRNRWEEAEARASALYALDPKDASVERVYKWVKTEGPKRREKELEDEIREVSSRDTRFSPTIKSIITDKKSEGLPPRSDLREAIEQIKASPYIPENYGSFIQSKDSDADFVVPKGRMAEMLEKQVSVQLDNVTLENLIFNLGESSGISFVADKSIPAFQQKLAGSMKSVKLANLLHYISRNMGVKFEVGGDLIWISDAKDTNRVATTVQSFPLRKSLVLPAAFGLSDSVKTFVTPAGQPTTTSETQNMQSFVKDGAPRMPAIETAIRNFVTTNNYHIDFERNVITIRGTDEQLRMVREIIDNFDKSVQQVLIEARFITVSEAAFLQLGVAWETGKNPLAQNRVATDYTGLGANGTLGQNVGLGLEETSTSVLGRDGLSATLTALDQGGESETLSAPRITLINNLPATISDGKIQYYYEEYTVTQTILPNRSSSSLAPKGKPAKLDSGVKLDVVASIGGDGKTILLALRPKVAAEVVLKTFATVTDHDDQGRVSSTFDIKLPELVEQSLATRVAVKSGQTVVMGGVSQREQRTFVEAVPVLGRLPLIGAAFRKRTELDTTRYLLVFVTATILSENGEYVVSPDAQ